MEAVPDAQRHIHIVPAAGSRALLSEVRGGLCTPANTGPTHPGLLSSSGRALPEERRDMGHNQVRVTYITFSAMQKQSRAYTWFDGTGKIYSIWPQPGSREDVSYLWLCGKNSFEFLGRPHYHQGVRLDHAYAWPPTFSMSTRKGEIMRQMSGKALWLSIPCDDPHGQTVDSRVRV